MSTTIKNCWAKIHRAAEHFDHFHSLVRGKTGPIRSSDSKKLHLDLNRYEVEIEATADVPPPSWGIAVGECLHQLRTTLDHLVYGLIIKSHDPGCQIKDCICKKASFPIFDKPNDFTSDWKLNIVKGLINADEFTTIEDSQPYKRHPKAPSRDALFLLKRFDDINKHRLVGVLNHRLVDSDKSRDYVTTEEIVKPGTKRFRKVFPIGDLRELPPSKVDMDAFSLRVVIAERELGPGQHELTEFLVTEFVDAAARRVTSIVKTFEPFFPQDTPPS